MKRGVSIAPLVLNVSHLSTRIAPASVRLWSQFRGAKKTQDAAAGHPRVRPPQRQIGARLVKEHEAPHIDAADPRAERVARLGLSDCPVSRAPLFETYPVRCSARNTLDRWTCASVVARWLYARVGCTLA